MPMKRAILLLVLLASPAGAVVFLPPTTPLPGSDGRDLTNPPGAASRVDFFDTRSDLSAGTMERVALESSGPARLILRDPRGQFPRTGSWTGPETSTAFPFTSLLPSYNPRCPEGTGLRFDVRTRDAGTGLWSPWFYLGSWGKTLGSEKRLTTDAAYGTVHIDFLALRRPADAYQVRVRFYAFTLDDAVNPALHRVAVCYTGAPGRAAPAYADPLFPPVSDDSWARDLAVPFRAQGADPIPRPLRPEICSPTSTSMVMQYLGLDKPTPENALAIYDAEYDLFGNWARAVAWAAENGFEAHLRRYHDFEQVKATIAAGQPIIASVRFKKGQCPSFIMQQTSGHLLVIRGMTRAGDLIVNDPASKERGNGAVYKADDVRRAWLDHGGVAYIIRRPPPAAAE